MMKIFLFGGFRVCCDGLTNSKRMTRSMVRLLAYLLLNRDRLHSRDVLSGLFWGDHGEKHARGCLRTALSRLRDALERPSVPRAHYLVTTGAGEVGFNTSSNYWLDVAVFEEQVGRAAAKRASAMDAEDALQLDNALRLRCGELLEGFYDDWILARRERLNDLHLRGMEHLMRYKSVLKAFDEAEMLGREILSLDPLQEHIHRDLMQLYAESGRKGMAFRQYKDCCRLMEKELSARPSMETIALYLKILGSRN